LKSKVLDEGNKRYFSYLYLKEFKENSNFFGHPIPDSLFENEKLFKTLEASRSYLLEDSVSQNKQKNIRMEDPNYSHIRELVQELISKFQENRVSDGTQDNRIASFFVLDFIRANYDFDIMCVGKGEEFKKKMDLMSSSLGLLEELLKINAYIHRREQGHCGLKGSKIDNNNKRNKFGEKLLIFYNYLHLLHSKHQSLFSNSKLEGHCQTTKLRFQEGLTKRYIQGLIYDNGYYLYQE
jgi:hypothetical protein